MPRKKKSGGFGKRKRESSNGQKGSDGFTLKKRSRFLDGDKAIDPGNYDLLRKFLTENGKVMPARLTGATAKQQRQIKRAVRRVRVMGLVP